MTPDVVVDVGNTRVKYGVCGPAGVATVYTNSGATDADFQDAVDVVCPSRPVRWVAAGVQPDRLAAFASWAKARGDRVLVLDDFRRLPLTVAVDAPERVGIDRLLGAVAVNVRRDPNQAAAFVDAGSAITVNVVDRDGVFRGGAIMPGLGLMGRALHQFTAKLPFVHPGVFAAGVPTVPATNTEDAIRCGLHAAAVGGVRNLVTTVTESFGPANVFVTGGDGSVLADGLRDLRPKRVLSLTLEGIRIAAEALP